jgi:hypothetical protein
VIKQAMLLSPFLLSLLGCSSGTGTGDGQTATPVSSGLVGAPTPSTTSPAGPASAAPAGPLRVSDLLSAPDAYLGREVVVDLVEDLEGPRTPEALATVQYGAVDVRTPGFGSLSLVPEPFEMSNPSRYLTKFDHVVVGPVEVRGTFERDDDPQLHKPYVLVVRSMRPLDLGAPVPAPPIAEVLAHRADWDGKYVVYEGIFRSSFELASIDGKLWLGGTATTERVGEPNPPVKEVSTTKVRVTGIIYAREGHRYGHMGVGQAEIVAYKIAYLR